MKFRYEKENESKKITIQEIAKKLDLSPTTVSRAISGKGRIGLETKNKVFQFLEEYQYIPNTTEKTKKRSKNICVLLPGEEGHAQLPYFQEILLSVYDCFSAWGYGVLLVKTTSTNIGELMSLVEQRKIDGAIFTRTMEGDLAIRYLEKQKIPFVVIGSWVEEQVIQVDFDQEGGCKDLASVLLRMNIKKIACVCGDAGHIVTQSRLRGIRDAYQEAGVLMDEDLLYTGAVYPSIVEKDVAKILKKGVDCILCLDDNICLSVLNALHKSRVKIPKDIKVASCYGGKSLANCYPSITCLEFDVKEIGGVASKKLLDAMSGKVDYNKLILGYNVLIKESTM
ncbi:LacI family DNA-binding transcriptional regulator [Candidatus Galacturonibacter soehngenii]|uniref:LacI family transcriptional regulator n=1 Tax=Candidatus Galacturonatibacter soehngenii TaxID=2307010 RepID=A0A7V7QJX8_9FIRM|nr:LacI family DNA-binding transcriptional regulator [Candidatus Galacturonibacter soehngenii]KAB1438008.1 LacI family transcriptional regulator [Candidatus Galacturonibacter soehngenii]